MTAILVLWNDCVPEAKARYEDWYTREHIIERVGIPGFRSGRRYQAIQGAPEFFTFYEVDNADVLSSAAYMERQNNPTPWTREVMASFRNMNRTVCEVVATAGVLTGSHVVVARFASPLAADAVVPARADIERLAGQSGIGRVHLWAASPTQTPPTHEMTLRTKPDDVIHGALVVECVRAEPANALAADLGSRPPAWLEPPGLGPIGVYEIICALQGTKP